MDRIILPLVIVPWLVFMAALVVLFATALKDERLSLGWLLGGSFLFEKRYRKYLFVLLAALVAMIGVLILFSWMHYP
jgi:hypothetical protein